VKNREWKRRSSKELQVANSVNQTASEPSCVLQRLSLQSVVRRLLLHGKYEYLSDMSDDRAFEVEARCSEQIT
jgi:hypothetical protein